MIIHKLAKEADRKAPKTEPQREQEPTAFPAPEKLKKSTRKIFSYGRLYATITKKKQNAVYS